MGLDFVWKVQQAQEVGNGRPLEPHPAGDFLLIDLGQFLQSFECDGLLDRIEVCSLDVCKPASGYRPCCKPVLNSPSNSNLDW